MAAPSYVSPQVLVWCECVALWSACCYGVVSDPLQGEQDNANRRYWVLLSCRAATGLILAYLISGSVTLACLLFVLVFVQPIIRWRLRMKWIAEFETLWLLGSTLLMFALIQRSGDVPRWPATAFSGPRLASLCLIAGTFIFVLRGGTYVVRGILRKAGTSLPRATVSSDAVSPVTFAIDIKEYNRGRLIGDLERIVLTIVIAGGSYAALAFLVAAKGLVRSEQFQKSSEFAEYFLVGSLASVLVSLCAGIALRLALLHLWPDLLNFQIQ